MVYLQFYNKFEAFTLKVICNARHRCAEKQQYSIKHGENVT